MKKQLASSLFTVALTLGVYVHCAAQSKTTDFSGAWALDKSKTPDLPPALESYTMNVTQDERQLTVETEVQGEIGRRDGTGSQGPGRGRRGGGGFPGGGRSGGIGFPGGRSGGIGYPGGGGTGGGGYPGGGGRGGGTPKDGAMTMALRMAPPKATYALDGSETTIQMEAREDGGQPGGAIVAKANWKNGGKILELESTRQLKTYGEERTITSKDRWELSNEGKTLIIKRAIEMPRGTNEVKLVFIKQ